VGTLEGRHWDSRGNPTDELLEFRACVARGQAAKAAEQDESVCTVETKRGRGSKISCPASSDGGKEVPRKFRFMAQSSTDPDTDADSGPTSKEVCMCLRVEDALVRKDVEVYAGCGPASSQCFFPEGFPE
jgi:hypothetical protein